MNPDVAMRVRQRVVDSRALQPLYLRARPRQRALAPRRGTELVIEGFPRSANTYAFAAMTVANPGLEPFISHHLHTSTSVVWAARRGVPTIVLVREPLPAVASLCQRAPEVRPATALRQYLSFYRRILPWRDEVVVASFDRVVGDFAGVVDAVNARYGTAFTRYERTEEAERRVEAMIEELDRRDNGGVLHEHTVARPSAHRRRQAEAAEARVRVEARLLDDAEQLYAAVTGAVVR